MNPQHGSRHQLPSHPDYPRHTCAIGWSPSLKTFYVEVIDAHDPNPADYTPSAYRTGPHPYIHLGCTARELPDATTAVDILRPYTDIPAGLLPQLKAEQAAAPGRGEQVIQIVITDNDL